MTTGAPNTAVTAETDTSVGANTVRAKLVTSLRNMLGPHHLAEGDSHGVCPYHFYKTPGGVFTPHDAAPWNDGYCFVKQGMTLPNA